MKSIVVLTQARLSSRRLPEKILLPINYQHNSITLLSKRLSMCKEPIKHFFIVPDEDKKLISFLQENFLSYETGPENDLILRHKLCAEKHNADVIVRVTSDCPIVDPKELDNFIRIFKNINNKYLYLSNHTPPEDSDFPNGSDIEIFTNECLNYIDAKYTEKIDREHVTFPMWDGREKDLITHLKIKRKNKPLNIHKIRLTLDNPEDLLVLRTLSDNINLETSSLSKIEETYIKLNLSHVNSKFDSREGWL